MRVLHVIPSIAATRGGPSYVVLRLARALAELGVGVSILATRADLDDEGRAEAEARRVLGEGVSLELVRAIGPSQIELSPALLPAIWRHLASVDVAHMHTVFTFPVAAAPLVCRAWGIAHVIRPAGTLDEDCVALRSTRRKRLAMAAYVRPNLVGANAVQATSEKEARELRALAPRAHVEVLEVGAHAVASALDGGGVGTRVGFLGRLHPTKQLEVLLAAMQHLGPEVELVLAGQGDPVYVASLRQRAAHLGRRVRFAGHLDESAKPGFFAACDVLAFPSLHESFGVAVAEAMAAGRAVVVSPGVALGEIIVARGAGVIAPAEPATFAAAIQRFLDDGPARARAAEAGRALALERWSWDSIARQTLALYERVLARRRR